GRRAAARPRTTRVRGGATRPATMARPGARSRSRCRQVEGAGSRAELLAALDLEALAERALEGISPVPLVHLLALGREQARDHRVVAVGELDHQPRAEPL